jgi:hypothetical protein
MAPHIAGTTPYPWPWNADLTGYGTAVTIVMPADEEPKLDAAELAAVHSIAASVQQAGGLVVSVTTRPPARKTDPPYKPRGVDIDPTIVNHHIEADGIDGFCGSRLEGLLRSHAVERLILAGAGLETCVHSTMRSANDRGFECLLVIDATAAYGPSLVAASVSMIEMSGGIFGAVGHAANVISAYRPAKGDRA